MQRNFAFLRLAVIASSSFPHNLNPHNPHTPELAKGYGRTPRKACKNSTTVSSIKQAAGRVAFASRRNPRNLKAIA